jgi:hypothetical protein
MAMYLNGVLVYTIATLLPLPQIWEWALVVTPTGILSPFGPKIGHPNLIPWANGNGDNLFLPSKTKSPTVLLEPHELFMERCDFVTQCCSAPTDRLRPMMMIQFFERSVSWLTGETDRRRMLAVSFFQAWIRNSSPPLKFSHARKDRDHAMI